jgi:hypothetical protein
MSEIDKFLEWLYEQGYVVMKGDAKTPLEEMDNLIDRWHDFFESWSP